MSKIHTLMSKEVHLGSGCGSVGRAAASNTRGPPFESSQWTFIYCRLYWKDATKGKIGRDCPILKRSSFWREKNCLRIASLRLAKPIQSSFKWAILGLIFVYFRLFKHTWQFLNKLCDFLCPFSIQHWDSNSVPSEHKSPPLTTRPGLPPKAD